jgi:hypothetical protein
MLFDFKRLILLTSIAMAFAGDKDHPRFDPGPATGFPNHQTASGVTVAAVPYETDAQAQPAFGKVNPYKYGVLPVLVVIQNDSKAAIRADRMKIAYIGPDHGKIEPTPAPELRYLHGAKEPKMVPGPLPGGLPHVGKPKQPLAEWEIEGRAFAAKMIPPGQTATGFVYFQTGHRTGSTLYLAGLVDAATGQELLYFELPLASVR